MKRFFSAFLAALLVASQAWAAIGGNTALGASNSVASATNVLTVTTDCAVGSSIWLASAATTQNLTSVTDSAGNTWHAITENVAGTGVIASYAFAANLTAALTNGVSTITATFAAATTSEIKAGCFQRGAKNAAQDVSGKTDTGLAATTTNSVSSGTLLSADEAIYMVVATPTSMGVCTACSGFANTGGTTTTTPALCNLRQVVASAASQSCQPTWVNSVNYAAVMWSSPGLWGGQLALTGGGQH